MGNVLSEEPDEETFLKEGFNLESPDADKEINYGAAAPRCQPKHTEEVEKAAAAALNKQDDDDDDDGNKNNNATEHKAINPNGGKSSSQSQQQQEEAEEDAKNGKQKLSYIQMARMGYQELVNAIIRPPRAEYKVRRDVVLLYMIILLLLFFLASYVLRRKRHLPRMTMGVDGENEFYAFGFSRRRCC